MEQISQSDSGVVSVKKSPMISEEEAKIRQDKLDTEKITSFVSIGGDSGRGVSIRFSDRQEPKRDGVASSPGSSSSECLQSQLTAVKLKLEQKRKKIEDDKKKVELMMTKQREKVGQEAFLRAVAKGMERSPKEGGGARVGDPERRPFILNEVRAATTPEVERNTLDLYQLQRDLQKQPEPFFISQPQQHTATQPIQQQQQQQPPATPPSQPQLPPAAPYYMYPGHPPPWYGMMPAGPVPYHPHPPHHPYYPHSSPHIITTPAPPATPPSQLQAAEKPQPLTDKPSLSTSFLEMKRRQCHHQSEPSPSVSPRPGSPPRTPVKQSLSSSFLRNKAESQASSENIPSETRNSRTPVSLDTPRPASSNSASEQSHHSLRSASPSVDQPAHQQSEDMPDNAKPAPEMTQSTLETLKSMTTESISKSDEDLSKGFVISFDAPVKPKPALKARQGSLTTAKVEVVKPAVMADSVPAPCDRQCLVCLIRPPGRNGKTCRLCDLLLEREGGGDTPCLTGKYSCQFTSDDSHSWCFNCWAGSARTVGLLRKVSTEEDEESLRQKDWVVMMTEKRRQQAEENRIKREEEALRRREEEIAKREELIRKKDEDKKRREAIFEAYKTKKEADKLKEEGLNFFSSKPPPKLRPKSAGGGRARPRPNTIHVDNNTERRNCDVNGSQNNISLYRSLTRGDNHYRRGSNVSLHDGGWSSGGSDNKSLSMFSRSKSSSASNLGPASLQLGVRGRHRQEDDNCSEISSTTSGYTSGRGSARLYREPVSKTNRPIIMNAVEYVVLPGEVNKDTRRRVLEEIEKCDCPHFLILFRDSKLQFRALYAFYPDTEEVFKIHGVGPRQVTDNMMDNYFKYNSGGKKFSQIHTKHLTVTIDAFTIHNSLWLGKKTRLPDKDMALVV